MAAMLRGLVSRGRSFSTAAASPKRLTVELISDTM
jgi:hypothetical protein